MAGGISNVSLARAVSKSGGLGFIAAGYKSVEVLEEEIVALQRENCLFGVNIFVPTQDVANEKEIESYKSKLRQNWQLKVSLPERLDDYLEEKIQLIKQYRVPFLSFTFGCPPEKMIKELQLNGSTVIITVTNGKEARIAQSLGANAICLQGLEAGGHRASFENKDPEHKKSLMELLIELKSYIHIPIIVAGGIMHGSQIQQYLQEGAEAVQLGTAFICCHESGANGVYKNALIQRKFSKTALTRAFTGRLARGLENDFIRQHNAMAPHAYPMVHYITQEIRKSAMANEDIQAMSLWAGEGFKEVRDLSAEELIKALVREAGLE